MRHNTGWPDDLNSLNGYFSILKAFKYYATKLYLYFQWLVFIIGHFCKIQLMGFFFTVLVSIPMTVKLSDIV